MEDPMSTNEAGREEYRLSGERVVDRVKELIHEGNVRRIIIKNEEGRTLVEVPLTVGVVGAVLAPVLAGVGAIAALVSDCSIEVEREVEAPAAVAAHASPRDQVWKIPEEDKHIDEQC
jgi:hypothetical protein